MPATLQLDREIDSRLAYRETDRQIYEVFTKKPLSASFDRLGNNATVAIYHANHWSNTEDFRIVPFQPDDGQLAIIEVYPALVKEAKTGVCMPRVTQRLPSGLPPRSDELDAAICAFHALAYGLGGKHADLPELIDPPTDMNRETLMSEGWIYSIPPHWLSKRDDAVRC